MKRKLSSVLLLMGSPLFIVLILLLLDPTNTTITLPDSSRLTSVAVYDEVQDQLLFDSLAQAFGQHKSLPKGFELSALRALSHYPELRNTPINFVFTTSHLEFQSRPEPLSVLFPWKPRVYQVLISTEVPKNLEAGRVDHLPYNALVGVFGHELAHTVSYLDKNSLQLSWIGLQYSFSAKYRQQFEQATDRRTIHHHLGYQLLHWSKLIHPKLELEGRGMNYLVPQSIQHEIESVR